jgi:hypothetical protein
MKGVGRMKRSIKTILIVFVLLLITMPTNVFAAHPPGNVVTLTTQSTTDTSALLGLLTPKDFDFTRYRVYLNGVYYFDSGNGVPPNAGTSISITGVSPGTTYTVRVTSLDSAGNESSGRSETFTTTGSKPTPTPSPTPVPTPVGALISLARGGNTIVPRIQIINYDDPKNVNTTDLLPYSYSKASKI